MLEQRPELSILTQGTEGGPRKPVRTEPLFESCLRIVESGAPVARQAVNEGALLEEDRIALEAPQRLLGDLDRLTGLPEARQALRFDEVVPWSAPDVLRGLCGEGQHPPVEDLRLRRWPSSTSVSARLSRLLALSGSTARARRWASAASP